MEMDNEMEKLILISSSIQIPSKESPRTIHYPNINLPYCPCPLSVMIHDIGENFEAVLIPKLSVPEIQKLNYLFVPKKDQHCKL